MLLGGGGGEVARAEGCVVRAATAAEGFYDCHLRVVWVFLLGAAMVVMVGVLWFLFFSILFFVDFLSSFCVVDVFRVAGGSSLRPGSGLGKLYLLGRRFIYFS